MTPLEFFKAYPNATEVHQVGSKLFLSRFKKAAELEARLSGNKLETITKDSLKKPKK